MFSFKSPPAFLFNALIGGFLLFLCTVPSLPVPDSTSDILPLSEHCSWIASIDRLLSQTILYLLGTGLAPCFNKKASQIRGGKLFSINSSKKNSFDLGLATILSNAICPRHLIKRSRGNWWLVLLSACSYTIFVLNLIAFEWKSLYYETSLQVLHLAWSCHSESPLDEVLLWSQGLKLPAVLSSSMGYMQRMCLLSTRL